MLDAFVAAEGAAGGGAAVGRRAVDPPRDPRHAGRGEGARDPAGDAQHQRHPARARRALRARAGRARRARLPAVRRLRRCHAPRDPRPRLQAVKRAALDRCADAGVGVSLVAAVERGINEHELGAIVRFGVEHPAVNGVFFQPVTHTGRHPAFDPLRPADERRDDPRRCARSCRSGFARTTSSPVPCCSPTCRSATYALYDGEDLVPLPRLVDVDHYLDYVTNRVVPDLEVAARAGGLVLGRGRRRDASAPATRLECVACGVDLPDELQRDRGARRS